MSKTAITTIAVALAAITGVGFWQGYSHAVPFPHQALPVWQAERLQRLFKMSPARGETSKISRRDNNNRKENVSDEQ